MTSVHVVNQRAAEDRIAEIHKQEGERNKGERAFSRSGARVVMSCARVGGARLLRGDLAVARKATRVH